MVKHMAQRQLAIVSTYAPIVCGIGTYTDQIARHAPYGALKVASFDFIQSGLKHSPGMDQNTHATYNINRDKMDAIGVDRDIHHLFKGEFDGSVLIQHEPGIQDDPVKHVEMIKCLRARGYPTAVSHHRIHFQSDETDSGMESTELELLAMELPEVDAITVFSEGVHNAVTSAFPEYGSKVHIIRHGIPQYGTLGFNSGHLAYTADTTGESREKMKDYLTEQGLMTEKLRSVLNDPEAVIVGATGFICPDKREASIFKMADEANAILKGMGYEKNPIHVVYMGSMRTGEDNEQKTKQMFEEAVSNGHVFIEHFVPDGMYSHALNMNDVVVFWPESATQSGRLVHAIGMGSNILGKDVEGVGETLRDAGYLALRDPEELSRRLAAYVVSGKSPEVFEIDEAKRAAYISRNNWTRITDDHFDMAENLASRFSRRYDQKNLVLYPLAAGAAR